MFAILKKLLGGKKLPPIHVDYGRFGHIRDTSDYDELFDPERIDVLPFAPEACGLVTIPGGAVLRRQVNHEPGKWHWHVEIVHEPITATLLPESDADREWGFRTVFVEQLGYMPPVMHVIQQTQNAQYPQSYVYGGANA